MEEFEIIDYSSDNFGTYTVKNKKTGVVETLSAREANKRGIIKYDVQEEIKKTLQGVAEGMALGATVIGLRSGLSIGKPLLSKIAPKASKGAAATKGTKALEEATKKSKGSLPKRIAKKAAIVGGGLAAVGGVLSFFDDEEEQLPEVDTSLAGAELAQSIAQAETQLGLPVGTIASNSNLSQQLGLDPAMLGMNTAGAFGVAGVYQGEETVSVEKPLGTSNVAGIQKEQRSKTINLFEYNKMFPINDLNALAEFKNKAVQAQFVSENAGIPELRAAWEELGTLSQNFYTQGQKLTPDDILGLQTNLLGTDEAAGSSMTRIDLSTEGQARALIDSVYNKLINRSATADEVKEFTKRLNVFERQNPSVTTSAQGSSVTTGGVVEADRVFLAEQEAMKDPLYDEFQNINVFGEALNKAIGLR